MEACLNTLHAFLGWIPLGYIFLTDLIDNLLIIFESKELKYHSLRCMLEIVVLPVESNDESESKKIKEKIFFLYSGFVQRLNSVFSCDFNLYMERVKLE